MEPVLDTLESMQAFVKVVELGSFSAAARLLNLSPSMVTKHIANLENRTGARLLSRTTRSLSTTEAGQNYFERCLAIIAALEEAETEAGAETTSARGLLRITAPAEFGNAHLSGIVARFLSLHPEVELLLDFSNRNADLVQESFDLAIRVARSLDTSLIGRRIATSQFRAVASPGYLAIHGEPATPQDVHRHRCLTFGVPLPWTNWSFTKDGATAEIRIRPRVLSTSAEALLHSARTGVGITLLPTFVCGQDIARGALKPVLTDYDLGSLGVYILYPHRRLLPARTRLFVDFLVAEIGGNAEADPWCPTGAAG